ncbi:glycoside hydrolase family 29 protein [Collybia nuda]|uniref:alpha-L-fucosidase n=1 Tax=Collybia nuda TaxID=64659 RepID=A0A9P6CKC4_9AGAR|nr:glycoside hydrolase family 29 protein [Collybia nuda]
MRSNMFVLLLSLLPWFGIVSAALVDYPSAILPLKNIFDNQAASPDGSANFDGHGSSFDSQHLPPGPWIFDGIKYDLPSTWGTSNDNVIANGQIVSLDEPTFVHELHFLYSGDASGGDFVASFVLTFTDNSTQDIQLYAKNWWMWPILNNGAIQTPYHFELDGAQKNFNASQIYQWSTSVSSERALKTITFPPNKVNRRLHLFGLSFSPSVTGGSPPSGPSLSVRRAKFTSRWETINGKRAQAVEVTLANLLPTHTLASNTSITRKHDITITGAGIKTVGPGSVYRLVPGDQVRVDVFVTGSRANGKANIQIADSGGKMIGSSAGWPVAPLIEKWTADANVLSTHETPTWWNRAKFGIFVHWGVYSYPAWAPNGTYAEWYDHDLHMTGSPTWNHHLQTFGKDVVYDDFITNFTASKFNASEWVDLFDRAGAKYFVLVTKHHDGYALFDTANTTHRSSVYLGPKRDFVSELMETAKKEKPDLHRGTYYSLPEWFNPDSAQYGFGQWPGGLAHNAFDNSSLEPYTGRLEINDYLEDLQLPQMLDLALKYGTEIMWCDIGGPNKTLEFASQFYNHAFATGLQVTINNRCGAVPDFDTPEYATFGTTQTQKWESNEGMDPFSYGLNSATQPNQYKNGTTIIQTLVDIVSKNGNFLLDVGPNAEGEIITPEANNLLDAGAWLDYSGECVYDTNYWFPGSQDDNASQTVRFTTTPKTFCVVAFDAPTNGQLVIHKRLPLLPGDTIKLLNPAKDVVDLPWSVNTDTGELTVNVSTDALTSGRFAWAFQIAYNLQ